MPAFNKPEWIICHHSGGSDQDPLQDSSNFTFKQCEELHKQRFNFKSTLGFWTGYQYVIEKNGKVYQARRDDEEGAHTVGRNKDSIGIMLCGNFDATLPTQAQIDALKGLIRQKLAQYNLSPDKVVPHRKFASKTCFGRKLQDTWGQDLVKVDDKNAKIRSLLEEALTLLK